MTGSSDSSITTSLSSEVSSRSVENTLSPFRAACPARASLRFPACFSFLSRRRAPHHRKRCHQCRRGLSFLLAGSPFPFPLAAFLPFPLFPLRLLFPFRFPSFLNTPAADEVLSPGAVATAVTVVFPLAEAEAVLPLGFLLRVLRRLFFLSFLGRLFFLSFLRRLDSRCFRSWALRRLASSFRRAARALRRFSNRWRRWWWSGCLFDSGLSLIHI